MNWKLPMWYHHLRVMTQNFSTITDQCRCCALCRRSLRKSCTASCLASSIKTKFCFHVNLNFGKKNSPNMALMTLMDNLINYLDNGEYIWICIFRLFNSSLLQKLSTYGIRRSALNWFHISLTNRYQFVTYNGVSSENKEVKWWVPQGSILGPLSFLIHINDLADVCKYSLPILFADDTILLNHGTDVAVIEWAFNKDLADISKWLKVKKLSWRNHVIISIWE